MQRMAGPVRRERDAGVEATLREISERIEIKAREFELLEKVDGLVRQRAAMLFEMYRNADARLRVEIMKAEGPSGEGAQEYFSGAVREYLSAHGFRTWDEYLKPTLSESENLRLRGAMAEEWMGLPAGTRNDPVAMYLLLMKHEIFGITGPRLDEKGLDLVQAVLAPAGE